MDILKKFFPISFNKSDSTSNLVIGIIIYLVIGIIAGAIIGLAGLITGWIPLVGALVGWVLRIIASVVELYVVAGIVILVLSFLKVLN